MFHWYAKKVAHRLDCGHRTLYDLAHKINGKVIHRITQNVKLFCGSSYFFFFLIQEWPTCPRWKTDQWFLSVGDTTLLIHVRKFHKREVCKILGCYSDFFRKKKERGWFYLVIKLRKIFGMDQWECVRNFERQNILFKLRMVGRM